MSAPSEAARAVVLLLSGGMDSTTLLWWLKQHNRGPIHAVSIDYGQRHRVELEAAAQVAEAAGAIAHRVLPLDLAGLGNSPLTDFSLAVPSASERRQAVTVVSFRNLLFVVLAAAYADTHGITDLYLAPVRDDEQAYRDCRRPFYDALEKTLQLGARQDAPFRVHTPFVDMWKSEVVRLGLDLGVPYELTHTCYEGARPACGRCDACHERLAAFAANIVTDPLPYREES